MGEVLQDVRVEQPAPGTAVAVFVGQHDLVTRDAVSRLLFSLLEENELVVVDFSAAYFVDGAMLEVLHSVDREAERRGRTFRLQLGTAPIVRRAFEISGLLEVLDCAPTREEALAGEAG